MIDMRNASILLIGVFFALMSCSEKESFKKGIIQLQSHPITLPLDKMRCMWNGKDTLSLHGKINPNFKLVVFLDTVACSSCELKAMYMWNEMLDKTKMYAPELSVYFIFLPLNKDLDSFYFTMRTMSPSLPIYVDTAGVFIRENPHIPRESVYHTFLLDKDNRVVLVGNPSRSEKIAEMFWQIVEEKLGKCE